MSNGYKKLWFAVLEQAINDAEGHVEGPKDYRKLITERARAWFFRKNQGIGSFLWLCLMLDLNPESVRRLIAKKYNSPSMRPRIDGKSKDKSLYRRGSQLKDLPVTSEQATIVSHGINYQKKKNI